MNTRTTNILTAREFIAQGTTAGAIMSTSAAPTVAGARAKVEAVAREVAAITGQSLQIPGALTKARESRRQRPVNDNRGRRAA